MPITNPRETFDRYQRELLDDVLVLGSMVEEAIQQSVTALVNRDLVSAQRIYRGDDRINQRRYRIENETLTLIATQQPMARDLRFLAAILEIITELERIGDYAKGISRINILLGDADVKGPYQDFQEMSDRGLDMLHRALDAFIHKDAEAARNIPDEDDEIDQLYNKVYRELISQMLNDPRSIDNASHLMWAAHNLERMADRVTNICERIVFVSTGEIRELDHSDDEQRIDI